MVVVGQPVPAPVMTTAGTTPTTLTVQAAQRKVKDFLLFSTILVLLCSCESIINFMELRMDEGKCKWK